MWGAGALAVDIFAADDLLLMDVLTLNRLSLTCTAVKHAVKFTEKLQLVRHINVLYCGQGQPEYRVLLSSRDRSILHESYLSPGDDEKLAAFFARLPQASATMTCHADPIRMERCRHPDERESLHGVFRTAASTVQFLDLSFVDQYISNAVLANMSRIFRRVHTVRLASDLFRFGLSESFFERFPLSVRRLELVGEMIFNRNGQAFYEYAGRNFSPNEWQRMANERGICLELQVE